MFQRPLLSQAVVVPVRERALSLSLLSFCVVHACTRVPPLLTPRGGQVNPFQFPARIVGRHALIISSSLPSRASKSIIPATDFKVIDRVGAGEVHPSPRLDTHSTPEPGRRYIALAAATSACCSQLASYRSRLPVCPFQSFPREIPPLSVSVTVIQQVSFCSFPVWEGGKQAI